MKKNFIVFILVFLVNCLQTQLVKPIIAGPMIGHTELRTSVIWMQFSSAVTTAELRYNNGKNSKLKFKVDGGEFNTATAVLTGLEPGKMYLGVYAFRQLPATFFKRIRSRMHFYSSFSRVVLP